MDYKKEIIKLVKNANDKYYLKIIYRFIKTLLE